MNYLFSLHPVLRDLLCIDTSRRRKEVNFRWGLSNIFPILQIDRLGFYANLEQMFVWKF